MTQEDLKMDRDNYPVSYNAPAKAKTKSELISEVAIVLREDGHSYIKEVETNYEPDLKEAINQIWEGTLVL